MTDPETIFYLNEFEHALDKQGRVAIPSAWRNSDGSGKFVLVPSSDSSLKLMPHPLFKEMIAEKVKKISLGDNVAAGELAVLGSSSQECVCDKQGRIQIGQKLLAHSGITEKVALVGAIAYIQIWAPERWEERRSNTADCYEVLGKLSSADGGK
jgi:MraZ protein